MSIELMQGLPGCGKSYYAVWRILDFLLNFPGVVVTNIAGLNLGAIEAYCQAKQADAGGYSQRVQVIEGEACRAFWEKAPDGAFIVIDEAHLWFSSRDWELRGKEALAYASEHRKRGHKVLLISQSAASIDKIWRDRAETILEVRNPKHIKILGIPIWRSARQIFWITEYAATDKGREEPQGSVRLIFDPAVGACYETWQSSAQGFSRGAKPAAVAAVSPGIGGDPAPALAGDVAQRRRSTFLGWIRTHRFYTAIACGFLALMSWLAWSSWDRLAWGIPGARRAPSRSASVSAGAPGGTAPGSARLLPAGSSMPAKAAPVVIPRRAYRVEMISAEVSEGDDVKLGIDWAPGLAVSLDGATVTLAGIGTAASVKVKGMVRSNAAADVEDGVQRIVRVGGTQTQARRAVSPEGTAVDIGTEITQWGTRWTCGINDGRCVGSYSDRTVESWDESGRYPRLADLECSWDTGQRGSWQLCGKLQVERVSRETRGIPIVEDIPLAGRLAQWWRTQRKRSVVYILIRYQVSSVEVHP